MTDNTNLLSNETQQTFDVTVTSIKQYIQTVLKSKDIQMPLLITLVPQIVQQLNQNLTLTSIEKKQAIISAFQILSSEFDNSNAQIIALFSQNVLPSLIDTVVYASKKINLASNSKKCFCF